VPELVWVVIRRSRRRTRSIIGRRISIGSHTFLPDHKRKSKCNYHWGRRATSGSTLFPCYIQLLSDLAMRCTRFGELADACWRPWHRRTCVTNIPHAIGHLGCGNTMSDPARPRPADGPPARLRMMALACAWYEPSSRECNRHMGRDALVKDSRRV
jgi:hypothetical protein